MHNAAAKSAPKYNFLKTQQARIILFVLAILLAIAYFPLNKPHGTVHSLQTALDIHIHPEPLFVLPYLLFIPIFWIVFILAFIKNRRFIALVLTIVSVYLVSDIVYFFYQTGVNRPIITGNDVFSHMLRGVYDHDKPYSAFPSLHSSLATVLAAYFWFSTKARKWLWVVAAFSAVVIASTLFTKQHYVPDVILGVALGAVFSALYFNFFGKKI